MVALILVAAICGGGYLIWGTRNPQRTSADLSLTGSSRTDEALFEVPSLINTKRQVSQPRERYTIDITYPTVGLANHPELAQEANAVISGFIGDLERNFITQTKELASPLVPEELTSDLTVRWNALLISPTIISIRFDSSQYVAGMAHPDSRTRILNYDLPRHRLLAPLDLFASSTAALPFLSEYTRGALRTRLSDEPEEIYQSQVIPGTTPTHEHFQEIGITKEGLLIIFNPYEVAPYARGTIELPLPIEVLTDATNTPGLDPDIFSAMTLAEENFREATPQF